MVIGAGPNGLAAAIRLAEAGVPVTVLEAAPRPGGAVRTEELTLPGFWHDTFSAVHPAAAASPVFARMPLERHGLEWVHPEVCMAHPLHEGVAVTLHRDVRATAQSLERRHPGDGERWARFVSPYVTAFEAVRATILGGFPPVGGSWNLLQAAGPRATARLGVLLARSAVGLGHRLFEGQGARAWLYGNAAHGDAPVSARGSAMAAVYLTLLAHGVGWPSPRGGAERLIDALVSHLMHLGGVIRTEAPVEKVLARGGRVTGVAVAGAGALGATHVLADVMPGALVAMTGDALACWYRRLLARYRYGPATVKVDWALERPIPWAAPDARRAGTVHVGGDERALTTSLAQAQRGLAERPFLLVGQQTIADPTRAPEGRHTAWAYTRAPARVSTQLGPRRPCVRSRTRWNALLPAFASASSPATCWARRRFRRATPTWCTAMSAAAATAACRQCSVPSLRSRPIAPRCAVSSSPSAAAFPGGAVHGVPGDAAARAALRSLGSGVS